jgi:2-phosphosulfolactate phosphatase
MTAKGIAKAVQRNDVIVIIDVLRCSSTIVTALANAAEGIVPTRTVREARMIHRKNPEFILAGERRGIKPKGFDLGNSPSEFSPQRVKGKCIILTTTSGTEAIVSSRNAKYVFIGALLNAKAVAKAALEVALQEKIGISLIPVGTSGHFSLEDFICAGAIAHGLPADEVEHSDAVLAALLAFRQARKSLDKVVQSSHHARRLKNKGFEKDVEFCCRLNVFEIVPFLRDEIVVLKQKGRLYNH